MNKSCIAYIDGYNLYHGIIDKRNIPPKGYKPFTQKRPWGNLLWLNLESFIKSYNFPQITLQKIKFFEAPSYKQDSHKRQQIYQNALISLSTMDNDSFYQGEFKVIEIFCSRCNQTFKSHVEKKTDVEISTEMLSDFYLSKCDAMILLGGDSDQIPVIRKIKMNNPDFEIFSISPPFRKSKEITKLLSESNCKTISYKRLLNNQLSDPVIYCGKSISKPNEYK